MAFQTRNASPFFNLLLIGSSLLLFYPIIKWLLKVYFGLYDALNLVILSAILFLIISNKNKQGKQLLAFETNAYTIMVLFFGVCLWIIGYCFLDIHIVSACAFFVCAYAIYGFYVPTAKWLSAFKPFVLILMTLPFGSILDVYIGFPLRLATTHLVSDFFHFAGYHAIQKASIITIENSATQIDFSCSGLKGIWSSAIFYFALSWLDHIKINLRWFLTLALLMCFILLSNFIRIVCLVYLISIAQLPNMADIVHAPLGIIGFVFSCLLIYLISKKILLKQSPSTTDKPFTAKKNWPSNKRVFKAGIPMLFVVLSFFSAPKKNSQFAKFDLKLPLHWKSTTLQFTQEEQQFVQDQGSQVIKLRFEVDSLTGSLLFIKSNGWRGHHNPEFCIRAGGNTINKISTIHLGVNAIKHIKINDSNNGYYWFQNAVETTDDFSTRIWAEIFTAQKEWIMTSIIFDAPNYKNQTNHVALLQELHSIINAQLKTNSNDFKN